MFSSRFSRGLALRPALALAAALALTLAFATNAPPARADARGADADACISAAEQSQPLRKAGKLRAARQKLITCARESCPKFVTADCIRWLADVDAVIPSVIVEAKDGRGHDVGDVHVWMDNEPLATKVDGVAFTVDPGEHVFRFEREGSPSLHQTVILREGERNRVLAVTFNTTKAVVVADRASPPHEPTPEDKPAIPVISWVLGGVGLVAIGVGSAFWISAQSAYSDLEGGCALAHRCAQSDIDANKTKFLVGDVVIGAGVVALVAATYFALTASGGGGAKKPIATHGGTVGTVGLRGARF